MAAKRDLGCRSKPSDVKSYGIADQKSRFREVVLSSHGLEDPVIKPAIQEAYCGGVAGKNLGGEGIDLV